MVSSLLVRISSNYMTLTTNARVAFLNFIGNSENGQEGPLTASNTAAVPSPCKLPALNFACVACCVVVIDDNCYGVTGADVNVWSYDGALNGNACE